MILHDLFLLVEKEDAIRLFYIQGREVFGIDDYGIVSLIECRLDFERFYRFVVKICH